MFIRFLYVIKREDAVGTRLEFLESENHLWVSRACINVHGVIFLLQVETIGTQSAWWTWRSPYQRSDSGKWIVDWDTGLSVKSTSIVRGSRSCLSMWRINVYINPDLWCAQANDDYNLLEPDSGEMSMELATPLLPTRAMFDMNILDSSPAPCLDPSSIPLPPSPDNHSSSNSPLSQIISSDRNAHYERSDLEGIELHHLEKALHPPWWEGFVLFDPHLRRHGFHIRSLWRQFVDLLPFYRPF